LEKSTSEGESPVLHLQSSVYGVLSKSHVPRAWSAKAETRGLAQIPCLVEVTGEDHVIGALVALPEELGEVLCGAPLRLGVPVPRLLGG